MSNAMKQNDIQKTIRYILKNIDDSKRVIEAAYKVRGNLTDLALNGHIAEQEFYKISSLLTPQSRSLIWQNYFMAKHNCKSINRNENKGDFEKNGMFYEYKASGYNRNNAVNIIQIRLWQNCDYVIQAISDESVVTFVLTHHQMEEETKKLMTSSAHGTPAVTSVNPRNELRVTLRRDSEDWDRWMKRYHRDALA